MKTRGGNQPTYAVILNHMRDRDHGTKTEHDKHARAPRSIGWRSVARSDDDVHGKCAHGNNTNRVQQLVLGVAVEPIVKRGKEAANNHDDDTNIVELVERACDVLRVAAYRVICGTKPKANHGSDKECAKTHHIERVRGTNRQAATGRYIVVMVLRRT